jgi:hypothetical protein
VSWEWRELAHSGQITCAKVKNFAQLESMSPAQAETCRAGASAIRFCLRIDAGFAELESKEAIRLASFDQICYGYRHNGFMRPALPEGAAGFCFFKPVAKRFVPVLRQAQGEDACFAPARFCRNSLIFAVKFAVMEERGTGIS